MSPVDLQGRHLESPRPSLGPWNCPACGVEQVGALELGCVACGAGKPGYRAPAVTPPPPTAIPAPIPPPTDPLTAFETWLLTRRPAEQQLRNLLEAAFRAGYQAGQAAGPPAVALAQDTFAASGKIARTLAAALILFLDQMIPAMGEEIAAGQYCSAQEIQTLIQSYQSSSEGA